MTKFSRVLTVLVTVLAIAFMGVAAVTTATSTDWKDAATKKFPKAEIAKQQEQLTSLDARIAAADAERERAIASAAADVKSVFDPETGREAQLEKELTLMIEQAHDLAEQAEVQARKTDAKLDELKLRREDTVRLQVQHDELVSQKLAAQADAKRLRDLLFQAQGVLERVQRRRALLEDQTGRKSMDANGAKKDYDKPN